MTYKFHFAIILILIFNMGEFMKIFGRYKCKALLLSILKALLAGAGVGLLVYGALLHLVKFEVVNNSAFPVLFGALSGSLCFLILLLLLRISNKKLARTLDNQYKLKEKVQTMLVHKDTEGAIYKLQREDALDSLKKVKGATFGLKRLWIYIIVALLGIGMLIVGIVVNPVVPEPEPVPEIPFELSSMQEAALLELIEYVEASNMQDPFKTNVKTAVSDLVTGLKLSQTVKERDICIDLALDTIYKETDDSSLALELINELWSCNTATSKALAKALNYYDWPLLDEWDKYSDAISDFRALFIYNPALAEDEVQAPDAENGEGEGAESGEGAENGEGTENGEEDLEAKMIVYVKPLFEGTAANILTALEKSGLSTDNELYTVLLRLVNASEIDDKLGTKLLGLSTLASYIDALGYTETERSLDDTMLALNSIIFKALSQHKDNTDTGEYAMSRICSIFSYTPPKFERPRLIEATVDSGSGDTEGGGGSGGIGGGPTFGSDDLVYDPNTGEYVEYGEILARYYALMYGKVTEGGYTEEEKAALEKYFAILQDGFPEEPEIEEGENENE